VVDNAALDKALHSGILLDAVLDVWENEPEIDRGLLNKVYIATPHIAGYSAEGKMNASRIVLEAFLRFAGYSGEAPILSLPCPCDAIVSACCERDAFLKIYSPKNDSIALKSEPSAFERLRNEYNLRREPASYKVVIS
jgi:erythronate-4-phosphate dehydrogenase